MEKKSEIEKERQKEKLRKATEVGRDAQELNALLIDNFVTLQRVMSDLAVKFDKLSDNVAKLLGLFEISARTFVEKTGIPEVQKDAEFLDKINMLLDQNKTIAKGLTLMEEKMRDRLYGGKPESPSNFSGMQIPKPEAYHNPQLEGMVPSIQNERIKKLPKI